VLAIAICIADLTEARVSTPLLYATIFADLFARIRTELNGSGQVPLPELRATIAAPAAIAATAHEWVSFFLPSAEFLNAI
jgi:hypothetical protein